MKNFIISIGLVLSLIGCANVNKSTVKNMGIKSVELATVQEFFPGVEQGDITYKFIFEFDLGKDVQIDSVSFNGKTSALVPFQRENSYTGKVGFSSDEINAFKKGGFIKNQAVVVYSVSGVKGIREVINNVKVLESTYMP